MDGRWLAGSGCVVLPLVLAFGCGSTGSGGSGASGSATGDASDAATGPSATATSAQTEASSGASMSSATASTGTGGKTSGCGAVGAATGDLHLHAPDGNGVTRDYELLVPTAYDSSIPLALTFVYHGAGGDESSSKAFGIQDASGAAAASIFVFPKGIPFQNYGIGWDDTCTGYDMPFFDAMVSSIESTYCIDPRRLFVAGFSWGGDQTTALTCCRGNEIRAVAPASCTDEYGNPADYTTYSDLPCPVTSDTAIRFTHDANGDAAYPNPLFATTSALYRSWNGCASTKTATSPSPCSTYDGCTNPYIECPYMGLGHAIPSDYGVATWAFFGGFH